MRIILILTVLLLFSCKEQRESRKIRDFKEEIDSTDILKKSKLDSIEKIVLLENGFDKDTVQIMLNQQTLFKGVISTDPRSGGAEALEIRSLESSNFLNFEMNGWSKNIPFTDSLFLHINKIGKDSIEVIYTEKFGGFY